MGADNKSNFLVSQVGSDPKSFILKTFCEIFAAVCDSLGSVIGDSPWHSPLKQRRARLALDTPAAHQA
jgi:hypothetical protein